MQTKEAVMGKAEEFFKAFEQGGTAGNIAEQVKIMFIVSMMMQKTLSKI